MIALRLLAAGLVGFGAWAALRGRDVPLPLPPPAPPGELTLSLPALPAPPPVAGRLSPADVLSLASAAGADGVLTPAELLAFVEVESAFRPAAYRFEPHLGEASYGLMQVLESTARDRGLMGAPEALYDPLTGLFYGVAQVAWTRDFLGRRYGRDATETEWVGAYNAGVGNTLRGFTPYAYLSRWQRARDTYAAQGLA